MAYFHFCVFTRFFVAVSCNGIFSLFCAYMFFLLLFHAMVYSFTEFKKNTLNGLVFLLLLYSFMVINLALL